MENNRLYRSKKDVIIGGVCGGLGEYFSADPVIFRIVFVVLSLFGGSGLLVYILFWIFIPENPEPFNKKSFTMDQNAQNQEPFNQKADNKIPQDSNRGGLIGGVILITLGLMFLADRFIPRIDFGDLWPLILIVAGVLVIQQSYKKNKE